MQRLGLGSRTRRFACFTLDRLACLRRLRRLAFGLGAILGSTVRATLRFESCLRGLRRLRFGLGACEPLTLGFAFRRLASFRLCCGGLIVLRPSTSGFGRLVLGLLARLGCIQSLGFGCCPLARDRFGILLGA
ncbi:MAG: hypothetical protein ACXWVP_12220 [Burkholderiales bacterium]